MVEYRLGEGGRNITGTAATVDCREHRLIHRIRDISGQQLAVCLIFVKPRAGDSGEGFADRSQAWIRPVVLERVLRWTLVLVAILGLLAGGIAYARQRGDIADLCFTLATVPVAAGLAVLMLRDLLAGRLGVDAIALVSMSAAIALRQPLAGAVVALMYAGGNVLEDIAVARAEHDLRSLVDRAPRQAHRRCADRRRLSRRPAHGTGGRDRSRRWRDRLAGGDRR